MSMGFYIHFLVPKVSTIVPASIFVLLLLLFVFVFLVFFWGELMSWAPMLQPLFFFLPKAGQSTSCPFLICGPFMKTLIFQLCHELLMLNIFVTSGLENYYIHLKYFCPVNYRSWSHANALSHSSAFCHCCRKILLLTNNRKKKILKIIKDLKI